MVEQALLLRPQANLQAPLPTALPHAFCSPAILSYFNFLIFFYIFREGRRKGGTERKKVKHWSLASHTRPDQGSNPHPRDVPWPEIKPANFWCTGRCSNQLSHTSYHFYSSYAIVPACPIGRNASPPYLLTNSTHSSRPSSSIICSVRSSQIHRKLLQQLLFCNPTHLYTHLYYWAQRVPG